MAVSMKSGGMENYSQRDLRWNPSGVELQWTLRSAPSGIPFSVRRRPCSLVGDSIHHSEYAKTWSACLLISSLEKELVSHLFAEKPVPAGLASRGHLYFTEIEPTTRTSLEQTSWLALRSASGFQLYTHALSGLQSLMAEASGMSQALLNQMFFSFSDSQIPMCRTLLG